MSTPVADRLGHLLAHVPDLTLEELDDLAGLSRGHASQIKRGAKVNPRPETVAKIAMVLGVRPSFLTYGEGDPPAERTVRAAVRAARGDVHASAPVRSRA